jgi:hypothetical protein
MSRSKGVGGVGVGIVGYTTGGSEVNALHYIGFYLLCTEAVLPKIEIQPRILHTAYSTPQKYSIGLRKTD